MSGSMMKKKKMTPELRFSEFFDIWEQKRIDKLLTKVSDQVKVDNDQNYQQIGIRSHGKGLFYKDLVKGKTLGNKRVFWVSPDVFVVNIVFAWEHAVAKTTGNEIGMVASHRFPMYKPVENESDINFILSYFLRPRGKYLLGVASPGGAGRNKTLGQQTFNELRIIVPKINEQQKIADFLASVDDWLDNLRQQKTTLETYKRGMMQKLFTQQVRFKDENGKDFPDWCMSLMSNVGDSYSGLSGKSGADFGQGEPFITYKQIFDSSVVDPERFSYVSIGPNEKQTRAKYGDILFTISSETPNEVGYASVVLTKTNPYLNSFSFGLRPKSLEEILPEFARYHFRSASFRRQVVKLAQGSTRYNISKVQFMKLKIELPSAPEQQKIADFLTSLDKGIESKQQQITKAEEWKKGLMQKMFI